MSDLGAAHDSCHHERAGTNMRHNLHEGVRA